MEFSRRGIRGIRVFGVVLAASFWCAILGWGESPAVTGFALPAKTSVPFTYCIWYRPDPENAAFLNDVQGSPPDLFHLGYHIPFKGALGPTYGHDLFSDDILSPAEIPREIERIKGVLQKMRDAGVEQLIPYVYTMAFFGNPERRTGFFHFFDHWKDYEALGIGPKPPGDPLLWLQAVQPQPLGGGPPDILHYTACVNHPAWSAYLDLVVRQLASVGYDGMFHDVNNQCCFCPYCQEKFHLYLFEKYGRQGLLDAFGTVDMRKLNLSTAGEDMEDLVLKEFKPYLASLWRKEHLGQVLGAENSSALKLEEDWRLLRCFMQGSLGEYSPRAHWRKYLAGRFGGTRIGKVPESQKKDFVQTVLRHHFQAFLESPGLAAQLERQFGSSDIRRRCLSKPRDLLLWVETQRFWCDSMASTLARLKRVGRSTLEEQGRKEDFYTVANLGPVATIDCMNKRRVDGIDLVRWARSSDMQMFEEMQQCGILESGVILSNIFGFRWAMGAGTRGGTLLYMVNDDRAADLAEAEVAAAGGGAFIQAATGAPESRKRWKTFYREHRDLWDGGTSCARVGLLYWNDQVYYEYPEHLAMTRRLVNIFSETQIPFDIVTEENLAGIGAYPVLFAPSLRYLDKIQIEALLKYADDGGNLIVIEPFGTEDKWARPQTKAVEVNVQVADFAVISRGQGRVMRLNPGSVPARSSDVWNLMEERGNHFERARDFLDATRRADIEAKVDLGPGFVEKIEAGLHLGLRWCPRETDPAVYVHAYNLPAKADRPERVVVHAVNYHMPILLKQGEKAQFAADVSPPTLSGEPSVCSALQLSIPLSDNRRVVRVEAISPVEEAGRITWHAEGNTVQLSLPTLRIYQAVVIETSSGS